MTSKSSAPRGCPSSRPAGRRSLDDRDVHRGRRAGAGLAVQQAVVPVQLDGGVGGLRAQHDDGPLGPVACVVESQDPARVLDQVLDKRSRRVLLLAVAVVGHQEREQVAADPPVDRLDAGHGVGPDAGGDRHRPRHDVDLLRVALPLLVGPGDREKLFGVGPGPFPELARQAGQAALVLHVMQELGRAVRVGGDDHLLGGVRVVVEVLGALRPAGVAGTDLEPASVERYEVVHLVQLVDLGAELLGEVEIVRRQLVLGVVAAAVVAVAARDAAGAPGSDAAEVRVVGLDAGRPK